MKSKMKQETTVTIELNNEERIWLKSVMQNPLYDVDSLEDEDPKDRSMRHMFFEAMGDW